MAKRSQSFRLQKMPYDQPELSSSAEDMVRMYANVTSRKFLPRSAPINNLYIVQSSTWNRTTLLLD